MRLKLRIWRQTGPTAPGRLEDYSADSVSPDMSFLEMLDVVNEGLIRLGKDAIAFAAMFPGAHKASAMDAVLHGERLAGKAKRRHRRALGALPDGAMIAFGEEVFAVRGKHLLRWTPDGYDEKRPRRNRIDVDVLTPPSIVAVLKMGYQPLWHSSAA